jgi:hypothetical protein
MEDTARHTLRVLLEAQLPLATGHSPFSPLCELPAYNVLRACSIFSFSPTLLKECIQFCVVLADGSFVTVQLTRRLTPIVRSLA